MWFSDLWHQYQDTSTSHPRVFIHITMALFFAFGSLSFAASIVISKLVKSMEQLRFLKLQKRFDQLISEVILSPDDAASGILSERYVFLIQATKKKYLRSAYAQNLMIDRMLQLKRSIEGNLEQRIVDLYRILELQRNSMKKVKKGPRFLVVKGMKEIAEMQIKEANFLLIENLTSSNKHVIREAQIALVKLNPQNPLYFLDKPGIFLTTWQMLRIHRFIKKNAKAGIPSFCKWLDSTNVSVLQFAIRMIGLFQQIEAAEQVAVFLSHQEAKIRRIAAITLLDLEAYHLAETLQNVLDTCPEFIDPITLKTLSRLSTGDQAVKMAYTLLDNEDYLLRKEAVYTLLEGGVDSEDIVSRVCEDEKPGLESIIRHLQDPLLA